MVDELLSKKKHQYICKTWFLEGFKLIRKKTWVTVSMLYLDLYESSNGKNETEDNSGNDTKV